MSPKLNTEFYVIPANGCYLGYAPLRRLVMTLSSEDVNLLVRLKAGRPRKPDLESLLIKSLKAVGIIDGPPEQKPASLVGASYLPTRVTLFLTNRCNLGCRYCYAGGQTETEVMDEDVGRAAIDYTIGNCKKRNEKILNIGFHGGGEPTMAWEQLVSLVGYAKRAAKRHRLELRTGMSSNACFSESRALWIAKNLSYISVSIDGPPRIQDRLRPMKNGHKSSPHVMRSLKILDKYGLKYSFQSTITDEVVRHMPDIVRYFARYTHPQFVKFEPVSDCGRFFGMSRRIPKGKVFARYFNEAYKVARRLGVNLSFSGLRLWGTAVSYFCGAFAEPFSVTPDGYVSACYEAYSSETPHSQIFHFGRFDREQGKFTFNLKKLDRLRQRNVYNLQPCKRCFCKYSCGGDCATRNFRIAGLANLKVVGARCEAIREITRFRLYKYLEDVQQTSHPGGKR